MTRRGLIAAAAIALALALPRAAEADEALREAAEAEGEMTFYTDLQLDVAQALVNAFNDKYPGIRVDVWRGDSGQVTQRFETESAAGRHIVDVLTVTDRQSKQFAAKGLTAPHRSAHADLYPEGLQAPDDMWSTFATVQLGIAWNTDEVSPEEAPKSWAELLEPKWTGRLGMQDPLQGGGAGIWVATLYGLMGEEDWTDFMSKLGKQDLRYGRYLEVREMLASGEIAVQLVAYPAYTQPLIDQGAPIEWALVDPALYTGQTLNLSANAPNPNAARLFIDFVMSEEGQRLLAEQKQVPALAAAMPPVYARIGEVELVPQAHELQAERFDFFDEKMKEFFVR